jgi:26S proteasome regulatory subunit N8
MPATTTADTLSLVTRTVSVAPLVLLSVADHYGRSAKGTKKRVVGVLLGQNDGKKNVRVSNSYAGKFFSPQTFPRIPSQSLQLPPHLSSRKPTEKKK